MDNYLQGFIDGYIKAMELTKEKSSKCKDEIDGKTIAESVYPHITLLQEKEKRVIENFKR